MHVTQSTARDRSVLPRAMQALERAGRAGRDASRLYHSAQRSMHPGGPQGMPRAAGSRAISSTFLPGGLRLRTCRVRSLRGRECLTKEARSRATDARPGRAQEVRFAEKGESGGGARAIGSLARPGPRRDLFSPIPGQPGSRTYEPVAHGRSLPPERKARGRSGDAEAAKAAHQTGRARDPPGVGGRSGRRLTRSKPLAGRDTRQRQVQTDGCVAARLDVA